MRRGSAVTDVNGSVSVAVRNLLLAWLQRDISADAFAWLRGACDRVGTSDRDLYLAVSLVSQRVGKADLVLGDADRAAATEVRRDWDPSGLSADQAARLVLVLSLTSDDGEALAARLEQLFITADVSELVTFYRGLPLYPDPERYLHRAAEGARSNMKAVFEAVALRNPYPAEVFPEETWNQMVLKALFVGSSLAPIHGITDRQNPVLARMLCDYAHERWAAGRSVSPELWRCVGPFAEGEALDDLARALSAVNEAEVAGAALALSSSPALQARELLSRRADLASAIGDGRLTWTTLAAQLQTSERVDGKDRGRRERNS